MVLDTEIARFKELLPELLEQYGEGKIAVIHARDLFGVFDDDSVAYRAALQAFGRVPFLLQPIIANPKRTRIPALELGLLRG